MGRSLTGFVMNLRRPCRPEQPWERNLALDREIQSASLEQKRRQCAWLSMLTAGPDSLICP